MTAEITILNRADARWCAAQFDPVAVVESVLRQHADGEVLLPAEGYMAWANSEGAYSRSVAMLGALTGDEPVYGLKLINASVSNPMKGLERAGGISVLFDPETARPRFLVEAGYLSGLRTAAYTICSLRRLGPEQITKVSVIGCGTIARFHLELIQRYFPSATDVYLYDIQRKRASQLSDWSAARWPHLAITVTDSALDCAQSAQVVMTLTVSDKPYAKLSWFLPGSFIAHVSLDDLEADVFSGAEAVFVDDVGLVRDNPRRILGSLMREGKITAPGETAPADGARPLDGTLGDVVLGRTPATRPSRGVVVSNPFGMAVLDVAMAAAVSRVAADAGLGHRVDLFGREEGGAP